MSLPSDSTPYFDTYPRLSSMKGSMNSDASFSMAVRVSPKIGYDGVYGGIVQMTSKMVDNGTNALNAFTNVAISILLLIALNLVLGIFVLILFLGVVCITVTVAIAVLVVWFFYLREQKRHNF